MDNFQETDEINFKSRIYTIRGQQVMLDSDLANIYGYDVKRLNEQVKRNISRFPEDFMFQLTSEDMRLLKSQNVTSSLSGIHKLALVPEKAQFLKSQNATSSWGGVRKLPYVFTEQGIYMLATVLRGDLADQQSIFIMRAFREMRHYIADSRSMIGPDQLRKIELYQNKTDRLEKSVAANQKKIMKLSDAFYSGKGLADKVLLEGTIVESEAAYARLFEQAGNTLILIDGYVDIKTFNLLDRVAASVKITIYTSHRSVKKIQLAAWNEFRTRHPASVLYLTDVCHDRFAYVDFGTKNAAVYHCGGSSKDAGRKLSAITMLEDAAVQQAVLDHAKTSAVTSADDDFQQNKT